MSVIKKFGNRKKGTIRLISEDTIAFAALFWRRFGLSMLAECIPLVEDKRARELFESSATIGKIVLICIEWR
ncbi:MAG: hypothetical protein C0391_01290 [Anaerolinea sp.]|nr:hypothetical protein [Anaerolinea sp.]